jgi:FdhE protein
MAPLQDNDEKGIYLEKTNCSEEIRKGLEEWAGETATSRFITFYLKLLAIQAEIERQLPLPQIDLERSQLEQRLRTGQPLFNPAEHPLDRPLVNKTFLRIAELFAEYPEVAGPVPQSFFNDEPYRWITAWLESGEVPLEVKEDPARAALWNAIAQQTVRPFLLGYTQALAGRYSQDAWRRSYCPVCGSAADFSYLDKEVGSRFLVCPTCSSEWQFQRTQCPYCLNADTTSLSFYTDETGLHRLYLCERCRSYLKAIDLRKTTEKINLAVESLTTLHLDRHASEMGYNRGARQDHKSE